MPNKVKARNGELVTHFADFAGLLPVNCARDGCCFEQARAERKRRAEARQKARL